MYVFSIEKGSVLLTLIQWNYSVDDGVYIQNTKDGARQYTSYAFSREKFVKQRLELNNYVFMKIFHYALNLLDTPSINL